MIPTIAIIYFAFVMQEAMSDIGIAGYIINAVRPFVNAAVFPMITFLLVAILNFSTGSVWGIPAIVTPIILPLAFQSGKSAADPWERSFPAQCSAVMPASIRMRRY